MTPIIYLGVVWIAEVKNGWYTYLKAFPEAIDKKGDAQLEHPAILKYIKERTAS
ncbi:MAG: hypothetical protein ACXV2C_03945 [Candidatus Bathyarchaeia archaeon]